MLQCCMTGTICSVGRVAGVSHHLVPVWSVARAPASPCMTLDLLTCTHTHTHTSSRDSDDDNIDIVMMTSVVIVMMTSIVIVMMTT